MKTPLYAVACAGIAAAGVYSYMQIGKHQELVDATNEKQDSLVVVQNGIDTTQVEYDEEKELRQQAGDALSKTNAELELKESDKTNIERTHAQLDRQIADQKVKLEEVDELIVKVQEAFEGQDVPLEEIPSYVEKLENERKDLSKKQEEVAVALEELNQKLEGTNSDLAELNKREQSRIKSLQQNSISSLITAVNSNWGFVVIKPHPNAEITEDSQLIVVRGTQHLGRINISAVEPNRVIADIDYDSLVAGSRVRAGDRVILAKANSR